MRRLNAAISHFTDELNNTMAVRDSTVLELVFAALAYAKEEKEEPREVQGELWFGEETPEQ